MGRDTSKVTDVENGRQHLQRLAADMLEQDRHKAEFLNMLGHELRNPLAAIRNSHELLRIMLQCPTGDRNHIDRALAILDRQSQHMTRLVNDLLDVTRISHGNVALQRQPTPLRDCLAQAAAFLRPQIEAQGLTLHVHLPDESLALDADPDRLFKMIENLLRNAITYTDAGGQIELWARRANGRARIGVRDTGIGIAPSALATLFDAYRRVDRERAGGLGLGLTLVKALAELHGGTIEAHSEGLCKGSEFILTLPLCDSAPAPRPSAQRPCLSQRVLVVDDQPDIADSFAALLESLGSRAEAAYSGEGALECARRLRPEIAFIDLSMPEMDGYQLAERLRREFAPTELKLVALTGYGHDDGEERPEARWDWRLLKPVDPETIVGVLHALSS